MKRELNFKDHPKYVKLNFFANYKNIAIWLNISTKFYFITIVLDIVS